MKKLGFTLAEILISLSIVGVIAALTIPTFTTNTQNQANAAKLSATVSTLENAYSAIIVGEEYDDFEVANLYGNYMNPDILGRYLKGGFGGKGGGATRIYGTSNPFKTITGEDVDLSSDDSYHYYYQLKSGAVIFGEDHPRNSSAGSLCIDVNGPAGPNKLGRDVFQFSLQNNGTLRPFGSNHTWATSDSITSKCKDGDLGNGSGCTGRLIENNYKVDY